MKLFVFQVTFIFAILLAACIPETIPPPTAAPTLSRTHTATNTHTPEPTSTSTPPPPSETATPLPEYALAGIVFFDYNGSGEREGVEPGIEGVPVCIDNLESSLCTLTSPDGSYSIESIPEGEHNVFVQSPNNTPATAFRYFNISRGWVDLPAYEINGVRVPAQHLPNAKVLPIEYPIPIETYGDDFNIALLQGIFTLPVSSLTKYYLWSYVDLDHRLGHVRNYADDSLPPINPYTSVDSPNIRSGTSDNHQGIDLNMETGNFLLAMAEGNVVQAQNEYHYVRVQHNVGSQSHVAGYAHNEINLVRQGDQIYRGQIVALSGDWKAPFVKTQPHVHLSNWIIPKNWMKNPIFYIFDSGEHEKVQYAEGEEVPIVHDIFRNILDPTSVTHWTVDNDPQHPEVEIAN